MLLVLEVLTCVRDRRKLEPESGKAARARRKPIYVVGYAKDLEIILYFDIYF
jgi:hypothetical protein